MAHSIATVIAGRQHGRPDREPGHGERSLKDRRCPIAQPGWDWAVGRDRSGRLCGTSEPRSCSASLRSKRAIALRAAQHMTEAVGRLGPLPQRGARALAFRFPLDPDRRSGRAGRLAGARAARLPALAELPDAADRGAAGRVHARQFPHRLFQRRDLPAVLQFGDVRDRHRGVRARARHRARLDERAHQHAVQEAVLRARRSSRWSSPASCSRWRGSCWRARRSGSSTSRCNGCSAPTTCSSTSTPWRG